MQDRLDILRDIGCSWWTLEVRDKAGVLQTKKIVDEYLTQQDDLDKSNVKGPLSYLRSQV
jgi:hypothetical protein